MVGLPTLSQPHQAWPVHRFAGDAPVNRDTREREYHALEKLHDNRNRTSLILVTFLLFVCLFFVCLLVFLLFCFVLCLFVRVLLLFLSSFSIFCPFVFVFVLF